MFQENEKYETYKDMTGTVRLTIKKASKKDKGKYTAKIFRVEKESCECNLNIVGEWVKVTEDDSKNNVNNENDITLLLQY